MSDTAPPADGAKKPPRYHRVMQVVLVAALMLGAFLLYRTLSRYSFDEIVRSITAVPLSRLLGAGGFAAASYLCLTGFDFLAVRYVGRPLPYWKTAVASFTALSIGHNVGLAALSSGAIRYRFYTRWGLTAEQVAKAVLFCATTVGLGLMILGGTALLLRPKLADEITGLGRPAILGLGLLCLALPLIYVVLSAIVRGSLRVGKWSFELPNIRLALGQVIIGPINFAFVAACLHQALAAVTDVPYLAVASVYVIATVTALIAHVPGGLGVIESVVRFLLPHGNLLGALIVFRFVYFLAPLCLGSATFATAELIRRRKEAAKPVAP